ncbi:helix-turn-helix domain-containing protein [Streptomyces sp. NRRL S-146]|uniref:helix-turn-helix domain-containing protein n=1 Tax=Streptomyces sp. NRRL S-146 TaxID=1463884 RepID=UPI00131C76B2|nr:helix-turn-helix transcriptional regulator [Streptomyces sp. NRRL S-146]
MADSKKRGRKPAPIRAETPEARRLTVFLRELRERSGKTYSDLSVELNWSRSSIGNHYSGAVPSREVVVQLVEATAFPHEVEQRKAEAVRLWERAAHPSAAQMAVRREPAEAQSAVARYMHDGRSRLSEADQQSRRLARELTAAQELVVMLTALNTSLDARIQELAATPDEGSSGQIQEQLSGVLQQLEQAQKDLVEARGARDQAEALAATARRRCLELEEELALLRLLTPAPRRLATLLSRSRGRVSTLRRCSPIRRRRCGPRGACWTRDARYGERQPTLLGWLLPPSLRAGWYGAASAGRPLHWFWGASWAACWP